jgi:VIT1/CCC1 family predicted Fe2+/Mn2+ transporter
MVLYVSGASLSFLVGLGMLAAKVGGANVWLGAFRVGFWGALAMLATAGIGMLFNVTVS